MSKKQDKGHGADEPEKADGGIGGPADGGEAESSHHPPSPPLLARSVFGIRIDTAEDDPLMVVAKVTLEAQGDAAQEELPAIPLGALFFATEHPELYAEWSLLMIKLGKAVITAFGQTLPDAVIPAIALKDMHLPCANCHHLGSTHLENRTDDSSPMKPKCSICGCTALAFTREQLMSLQQQRPATPRKKGPHDH